MYETLIIVVAAFIASIIAYLVYKHHNSSGIVGSNCGSNKENFGIGELVDLGEWGVKEVSKLTHPNRNPPQLPPGAQVTECGWRGICNRNDGTMGVCHNYKCYPSTHTSEQNYDESIYNQKARHHR